MRGMGGVFRIKGDQNHIREWRLAVVLPAVAEIVVTPGKDDSTGTAVISEVSMYRPVVTLVVVRPHEVLVAQETMDSHAEEVKISDVEVLIKFLRIHLPKGDGPYTLSLQVTIHLIEYTLYSPPKK